MRLIWKLLRKHISLFELGVFFVANLIGMVVILAGVQLYTDLRPVVSGDNALIGNDYVVISKPVKRVNSKVAFSREEIEDLKAQPFTLRLGEFTPAQYQISGGINIGGQSLSTLLFFEAIPDEFMDVKSNEWKFKAGKHKVPIVIPRSYLNLYNFGFSQTVEQMPQITESMMKDLELELKLSGDGHTQKFTGKVIGFSDRLNTILVPADFIAWSNKRFAKNNEVEISRLILEVINPSDPELLKYFKEHGYVPESKPAESNKALFLLRVSVGVIIVIGLVFSILSLIILTLSIYLLLQKNIDKLENLRLLGYSTSAVARPYNMIAIVLSVSIMVLSLWIISQLRLLYIDYLMESTGRQIDGTMAITIVVGAVLMLGIILFNMGIIRRKIVEISRKR
ncbi:MAG: ABC transporter permease [Alistipes sp.]|nr:ABC transporter permease [Alistipes sp.]MBO7306785.1 ABC transporter permease [Alistipes sp.]